MSNKKILILISLVITIILVFIAFKYIANEQKMEESSNLLMKIENIKYDSARFSYCTMDIKYLVYDNGTIEKYDNLKGTISKYGNLSREELNKFFNLITEIDKENIDNIYTNMAITKGMIITVYRNNESIKIRDFYTSNQSDSTFEIVKILNAKGLIEK